MEEAVKNAALILVAVSLGVFDRRVHHFAEVRFHRYKGERGLGMILVYLETVTIIEILNDVYFIPKIVISRTARFLSTCVIFQRKIE
jgi:hypothetical protein